MGTELQRFEAETEADIIAMGLDEEDAQAYRERRHRTILYAVIVAGQESGADRALAWLDHGGPQWLEWLDPRNVVPHIRLWRDRRRERAGWRRYQRMFDAAGVELAPWQHRWLRDLVKSGKERGDGH